MKLSQPSRHTSFYESFSDLIFATMAIFILLFVVVMTQMRPEQITKEEIEELVKQAERAKVVEEQIERVKEELRDAVATHPLEIVIAIDTTGSMQAAIDILKSVVRELATELPDVASEFRLGIVSYRETTNELPLMPIAPIRQDGGSSFGILDDYLSKLSAQPGLAYIAEAIDRAIEQLENRGDGEARKTLAVIGDVGPYEYDTSQSPAITTGEKQLENQIIGRISAFSRSFEKASVLAVYTGDMVGAPRQPWDYKSESSNFFRSIATAAGESGEWTNVPRELLLMLLLSILSTEKH